MGRAELNQTFTRLIGQIGLEGRGARARPRPHDLRHAFAVRTLLDWYRDGEDIDQRMPLLSTYLGHVDPSSTYWYLEEGSGIASDERESAGRLISRASEWSCSSAA
jgi:integrase